MICLTTHDKKYRLIWLPQDQPERDRLLIYRHQVKLDSKVAFKVEADYRTASLANYLELTPEDWTNLTLSLREAAWRASLEPYALKLADHDINLANLLLVLAFRLINSRVSPLNLGYLPAGCSLGNVNGRLFNIDTNLAANLPNPDSLVIRNYLDELVTNLNP